MTNKISQSITAVTTSVPNVIATIKAYPLAKLFLSCPYAAKILKAERFIKPILIDIQNIGPRTVTAWNKDHTSCVFAKIFIPENVQTTNKLRDLAYEIFNTQTTSDSLFQQAILGNVGMDSYARQIEEPEVSDTQEHYKLIKECANHWEMSPEELKEYTSEENEHPELTLFIQEFNCHTDIYRQEWIEQMQEIYCAKHPGDTRSCETKKTDLCNAQRVKSMPQPEREAFLKERICQRLPQAHAAVKNDPEIRMLIQDKCPEALEISSKQPMKEDL